jgi:hypothetical protein
MIQYVTAFYDIGRSEWDSFERSTQHYIESAMNYLKLDYNIIMYIDDKYVDIFHQFKKENQIIVPINEKWLTDNIYTWRQLEQDEKIIKSFQYQTLVYERILRKYPENIFSRYNLINHSKIDFINHAINNYHLDEFIFWVDFGYFYSILGNKEIKFPRRPLDVNKFNLSKINFFLRSEIKPSDLDIIQTLQNPREVFTGSLFAGPKNLMSLFQQRCHEALEEFHHHNISDDDQHLYLRVYSRFPNLFHVVIDHDKWPEILREYQLT